MASDQLQNYDVPLLLLAMAGIKRASNIRLLKIRG
jgi:hypothetical protein